MAIVSVITPIYNVERYLPECLDSLLSQTLEDIEFICVNDGSTDGSGEILRSYAARDPRIIVIEKENSGYGASMNVGLDAASGEYIGIVESDDFASPEMFETLYQLAVDHGQPDIVKSNYYNFSDEKGIALRENFSPEHCGKVITPGDESFMKVFNATPAIWSAIYRRAFLEENGIRFLETPGASFQDTGFVFKSVIAADAIFITHDAFLHYRVDNSSSSVKSTAKQFCVCDELHSVEEFLENYPSRREALSPALVTRKYITYDWNYRRLPVDAGDEFLEKFSHELRMARDAGHFDRKFFNKRQWHEANLIADCPIGYRNHIRAATMQPSDIKVSVIVAGYNAEKYLAETLDSLVEQTLFDIEIIAVDDGSTDGTGAVMERYAAKDLRISVHRRPNSGAAASRNYGISQSSGEYLAILDADDVFEPVMLERAYERATATGADVVVFRSDQFSTKTGKKKGLGHTMRTELLPKREPFAGADIETDVFNAFMGWAWDKLFRREFVQVEGFQFQEQRTTNDLLFVFSAIVRAGRIATLSDVLAHYRRDVGGLSETRDDSWQCFYHALVALREKLNAWGVYERYEQDYINYCVQLAAWHVRSVDEKTQRLMSEKLNDEWLDDLGVSGKDEDYFYRPEQRALLLETIQSSLEEASAKPESAKGKSSKKGITQKVAGVYARDGFTGLVKKVGEKARSRK